MRLLEQHALLVGAAGAVALRQAAASLFGRHVDVTPVVARTQQLEVARRLRSVA